MVGETVHKLILPSPVRARLYETILCWSRAGGYQDTSPGLALYAKSINDVTCVVCKDLWARGIYR